MEDKKGVEGDPYDLPDPDLKIILLGDSAVGKSKLIERYLMDEYNPRQVFSCFSVCSLLRVVFVI
jgi:GTPase SAR1 family protein